MSERELQSAVIELARLLKYRVAHFRPAMTRAGRWVTAVAGDGAGFPDLVIAGNGRLIFAELKSGKGRLSREQAEWIAALEGVRVFDDSVEVHVWRPPDWLDGTIERVLKGEGST